MIFMRTKYLLIILALCLNLICLYSISAITICNPSLPNGCPEETVSSPSVSVNYSEVGVNDSFYLRGLSPQEVADLFVEQDPNYFSNPSDYYNSTTLPSIWTTLQNFFGGILIQNNTLIFSSDYTGGGETESTSLSSFKFDNGTSGNVSLYDDSLVLMMNFDNLSSLGENDTHVKDVSRWANNGTITGATFNVSGKYGGAYQFDGNDKVSITNSVSLASTSATKSFGTWIKLASLTSPYSMIMGKHFYSAQYGSWGMNLNASGNPTCCFYLTSGTAAWCVIGDTPLTVGQWYNIMCVYNGSEARTYLNGQVIGNISATGTLSHDDSSPTVIGLSGDNMWGTNGLIDEVRIYNRSLSQAEIQQLYRSNLNKYNSTTWGFNSTQAGTTCLTRTGGTETCSSVSANSLTQYNPPIIIPSEKQSNGTMSYNQSGFYVDRNFTTAEYSIAKDFITLSDVPDTKDGKTALDSLNNIDTWLDDDRKIVHTNHYAFVNLTSKYPVGFEKGKVIWATTSQEGLSTSKRLAEMEKMIWELRNQLNELNKTCIRK
jgi:hypothetical protein